MRTDRKGDIQKWRHRVKGYGANLWWLIRGVSQILWRHESTLVVSRLILSRRDRHDHQTSHFLTGFIFDPARHWKSRAKSGELEKGPITRNRPGEWAPVLIRFSNVFGRYLEHHVLAAPTQKSCLWLRFKPGRICSSPWRDSHLPGKLWRKWCFAFLRRQSIIPIAEKVKT